VSVSGSCYRTGAEFIELGFFVCVCGRDSGSMCAMKGGEMAEDMGFAAKGMEIEVVEGKTETETEALGAGELQQRRDENAELGYTDEGFGTGDERVNVIMGGGNKDEDGDGDGAMVTSGDKLDGGDEVVARGDASVETCVDLNLQDTAFELEDEERERTEIGNAETAVEGDVGIEGALTAATLVPAVDDSTGSPNLNTTMDDLNSTDRFTNSISNDVQSSSVSDEVVMIEALVDEPNDDKEMENYIEPEKPIQEHVRFFDQIELENLEGLPAPMPSLDSSPNKPLITTQNSRLVDQGSHAEPIEEEPVLPPLPKEQAAVEIQKAEIPDSDAFTESSIPSPGKADGKLNSSPVLPKYRNAEFNDGDGDGGAGQSGRVMSSFGRRCETSDEVDVLMVDEGVGGDTAVGGAMKTREGLGDKITSLPVIVDLAIETKQSAEAVERLQNSVALLYEDEETPTSPPEAYDVNEEVSKSPTQKKVKKRGRPPGRKSSALVINREEDHEPAPKKTKTDEVVSDPPMKEADAEEKILLKEKKRRGRPAGRNVPHLSVNNSEDDDVSDDNVDASSGKETVEVKTVSTIGEIPNTTSTSEELANGESNNRQEKIPRLAVDDSEDDGEEMQSPSKTTSTKVAESASLSGGFDDQKSFTETIETSLADETVDDQSPVQERKRRGRPAGSKPPTLSARKETEGGDLVVEGSMIIDTPSVGAGDKTQQSTTDRERDDEPTAYEHSTPSAEKKKRGRPAKRKASTLSTNGKENTEVEPAVATATDEPVLVETTGAVEIAPKSPNESSPTLSRRGRPPGRKISKISQNREDGVDGVDANLLPDSGIIDDTALSTHISPPEKKKRGRPAGRKVSGITAEANVPPEDAHQDTAEIVGEDKSINDVSPDKKRRGRPPVKKDQISGNEQVQLGPEQNSDIDLSEENAGNEDHNAAVEREESLEGERAPEVKKKRGRPSGSVTKGNEAIRATDNEENEDTISPAKIKASSTPNIQATEKEESRNSSKILGSPSISRSESPSTSQSKEILFAELKAIKIVPLPFPSSPIPIPSLFLSLPISPSLPISTPPPNLPPHLVLPPIPHLDSANRAPGPTPASRRSENRTPRPARRNGEEAYPLVA
jgi:hypothetical protein